MSASYTFTDNQELLDSTVLVEESIVWDQEEECGDSQQAYADDSHTVLTTTINDSYVTADEGPNETQYFSILDPSMLGEENITIENAKVTESDETTTQINEQELMLDATSVNGHEVLLYQVPGDGLYGIQVAEDEEGNLRKYQFKIQYVSISIVA